MACGDSSRMPPRPRYRVRTGFAPCCRERILRACRQIPNDSSSAFMHVTPPMQTRDQTEMVHGGIRNMRVLDCLKVLSFGVGLALSFPPGASAQDGEQVWQRCIAAATAPDNRVSACTSVIDAKTETGRKLAAAYCTRGHGPTEKR